MFLQDVLHFPTGTKFQIQECSGDGPRYWYLFTGSEFSYSRCMKLYSDYELVTLTALVGICREEMRQKKKRHKFYCRYRRESLNQPGFHIDITSFRAIYGPLRSLPKLYELLSEVVMKIM